MREKRTIKRLSLTLAALGCCCLLAACGTLAPSTEAAINLPDLPAAAKKHYAPVALPSIALQEGLSAADTQRYWGKDRGTAAMCGATLDGVVGNYEALRVSLKAADKH